MGDVNDIRGLTPLRGIAALLVMVFHYHLFIAPILPPGSPPIIDKLYLMVDLFFVLSGFIMYHVYGSYFRESVARPALGVFVRARFARLYPLHLVTLLYLVVLAVAVRSMGVTVDGLFGSFLDYSALPYQVLLLQGVGPRNEALWNSPTWSISTEWWAYMVFPFLVLFLAKTAAWSRYLLAVLVIASFVAITTWFQPMAWALRWEEFGIPDSVPYPEGTINVITRAALLRCLCGFVIGMLIYEMYLKGVFRRLLGSGSVFILCWVVLFVLWPLGLLYDPITVVIFAIMILSVAFNEGRVGDVLDMRAFRFLGDISYSLYMIHVPMIITFVLYRRSMYPDDPMAANALGLGIGFNFPLDQSLVGLVAFIAIAIVLSGLSYIYVEKPARAYLKKGRRPG